jgi:hypothetical protein
MFQLKMHGHLSFTEMDLLTAEDRAWWMTRLNKFHEEQEKAGKGHTPSMPSMPNVPKP